jgi:hypothetical protein
MPAPRELSMRAGVASALGEGAELKPLIIEALRRCPRYAS